MAIRHRGAARGRPHAQKNTAPPLTPPENSTLAAHVACSYESTQNKFPECPAGPTADGRTAAACVRYPRFARSTPPRQPTPASLWCRPDRPAAPATSWRRSSCDSFATVYRATWLAPRLCGVTVESALPAITPHLMPPAVDRRTAPQSYWTTAVQAAASLRRRSCCCGYRRLGA